MISGKGMLWAFDNKKMPIQGIVEGLAHYKEKHGKSANCVHVSFEQSLTSLASIVIQGVSIVPDKTILKDCIWIGEE